MAKKTYKKPTTVVTKEEGPWIGEGENRRSVCYSDLPDVQMVFTAVDFKNCKKNTFKIGHGAYTLFYKLDWHYTKEELEHYGRLTYSNFMNKNIIKI